MPFFTLQSSAASSPEYSATLLVACGSAPESSASVSPSGACTTTPQPAGPGLPRAPPSMYAVCAAAGRGLSPVVNRSSFEVCSSAVLQLGAGLGLRLGRLVVQDALAAVTLHDLGIAADVLRHARPQPDVTGGAHLT